MKLNQEVAISPIKSTGKVEKINLKGSNTVGEALAPLLAQQFLRSINASLIETRILENPVEKIVSGYVAATDTHYEISIFAHGSSTGFKALIGDDTDIAMSSRAIKPNEKDLIALKGGDLKEHAIALDALAVVTYPGNPLSALTVEQVAQIFSGEIKNWSVLGGEDRDIELFSRDDNSGTWDTFKSLVLKIYSRQLDKGSKRFESSSDLVSEVTNSQGGIGFVGVAYTGKAKILKVAENAARVATLPEKFTIGTQNYALSRKLFFYTNQSKLSNLASRFIAFTEQNQGQQLTEKVGLISYYPTRQSPGVIDKSLPKKYQELARLGQRITVDFSANGDEINLAKQSRDLERLTHYVKQNPHKKLVLVDHSGVQAGLRVIKLLKTRNIPILDTVNLASGMATNNVEVWVL